MTQDHAASQNDVNEMEIVGYDAK